MKTDDLHATPLHAVLAGLFACLASVIAAFGWLEALSLDVTRSIVFARPGRPIETGWQPIAVGVTSITIGANVAVGVLRRGFSRPDSRLFLALLFAGMLAWVAFGFAGIYAGVEAFELLARPESRGRG
jgi:hypothetical protein